MHTKQFNGEMQTFYKAELQIGITKEMHSGLYECSSTEFPELSAYYYVYVPGQMN